MPPQDPQAEYALLARMKQGDESAFVDLYRRHREAVYRFAMLFCGSTHAAGDVTQETFLHLMTHAHQFDPARGTVGAWLCGVARNMARRHMNVREEATEPEKLADDAAPFESQVEHETPLERVLRAESAEQVRRAIARLAPHYRDVLVLCEISELTYAEAAQVCGIDIGTVRSRLSRARAELARRLARYALPREERATEAQR